MSDPVTIVVDVSSNTTMDSMYHMQFNGWGITHEQPWNSYNDTISYSVVDHNASFSLTYGRTDVISAAFFGKTPNIVTGSAPPYFTVHDPFVLNSSQQVVSYPPTSTSGEFFSSNSTQYSALWFDFHGDAPMIDYVLLTVTDSFDIRGKTILVDDSNSEITWHGWTSDFVNTSSPSWSPTIGNFVPHGNGKHSSKNVGDSFTFQFAGTTILVAGIDPTSENCLDCQLAMNFTIDSNSTIRHFQFTGGVSFPTTPHFTYFSAESLEPGNHTLTATITSIKGDIGAYIDYLTYTPSFETLLDKPVFSQLPSNTEQSNIESARGNHVGIIAGAVVGGLITLVLLGLGGFFLYQKRRIKSFPSALSGYVVEPFTLPHPIHPERMKGYIPPASSFEERWREEKGGRVLTANPVPIPVETQELRQQRDTLAQGIETLEARSVQMEGDENDSGDRECLRDLIMEMRTQVNTISRDISRHVVPPAYGTETIRDA
ncbi:hypothetical protein VKT23_011239 [Stygiomarasmius scandens]|uniref:Uncharacterized protein n=1 Tax=Marasmiellus scandens TaxID=2682957 RepID=A0ABR1JD05_9AGAR